MAELRKISENELKKILEDHKTWLESDGEKGVRADLSDTNLSNANLRGANLSHADLRNVYLGSTWISHVNLSMADLSFANFILVDLRHANLENASLLFTRFSDTNLENSIFSGAKCFRTVFADIDLSNVFGLEYIKHGNTSVISIDTLTKSKGKIPEKFLRGCGVPNEWIDYIPALTTTSIQHYSCFISYSHKDEEFAQKLYDDLQNAGIRCWFAPEEMKGGKKLFDQISDAIRVQDKLLLVLSESSLQSEWVETEIRKCRKEELKTSQQKLFPITLVDFNVIKEWECFDADTGKDLGVELREYFIPDFSNWTNENEYKNSLQRLIKDLKSDISIDEKKNN